MYLPVYKLAAFLLEYRFCSVLYDKLCCNHWRLEIQDTILSRCWSSACIPPHVPCKHLQHMEMVPYSHLTSCSLNYQELLSRELKKKAGETPWHHLVFFLKFPCLCVLQAFPYYHPIKFGTATNSKLNCWQVGFSEW